MMLDDAIQAANGGDINAMFTLGNFFFEQKETSRSMMWFYRAAQARHIPSAEKASALGAALAKACEEAGDWDGAVNYWKQCEACQPVIMSAPDATTGERLLALQTTNQALYGQGVAYYHLNQIDLAIMFLEAAAKDTESVAGNESAKELLKKLNR